MEEAQVGRAAVDLTRSKFRLRVCDSSISKTTSADFILSVNAHVHTPGPTCLALDDGIIDFSLSRSLSRLLI
jgi:hypothetical protein